MMVLKPSPLMRLRSASTVDSLREDQKEAGSLSPK
jgi:hypothetical protein